jgi:ABC-type phosphate transport system substrate-binding protein
VFPRRLIGLVAFLGISASYSLARDLAVISNKANAVSTLGQAELVKLAKGEMGRLPDGRRTVFIMRAPSTPEMKVLLEKVYEQSAAQVSELISTANHGRANYPTIMVVDSDEDLVNKVASLPGAIGVVDVYAINSSVTVVKIAGKLPLEPGYFLHGN